MHWVYKLDAELGWRPEPGCCWCCDLKEVPTLTLGYRKGGVSYSSPESLSP